VLVLRRSPHPREQVRRVAFRLTRRRREKTTSADVSGLPSAKWGFFVSLNVNVFALALVQDRTSDGTGRNATVSQGYVRPGHRRLRGHQLDTSRCGRGTHTPTFTQVKLLRTPPAHLRMQDT